MTCWDVNPHIALWRQERSESQYDCDFAKFHDAVAKGLGVPDLDGDSHIDGYSIDWAHDLFADGCDVENAVLEFKAHQDELSGVEA